MRFWQSELAAQAFASVVHGELAFAVEALMQSVQTGAREPPSHEEASPPPESLAASLPPPELLPLDPLELPDELPEMPLLEPLELPVVPEELPDEGHPMQSP